MSPLLSLAPPLPVLVFVAETVVVTLGTIRTICVARGRKLLAPLLGFFEISVWLFAIGQILQNLSDPACYLAFAAGFTTGNFCGIFLEKQLALGTLVVQVITAKDPAALIAGLRQANYGVTTLEGQGATGPVRVVVSVVRRRELAAVVSIIQRFDAKAFYAVDDLHSAAAGIFPASRPRGPVPAALGLVRAGNG